MGRRGPPKLPEDVRRRRGTLQKCRTNAAAPDVEHGRPVAPDWLGEDARKEWARIVPLLDSAGLLTRVGRAALAGYCTAWGELAEAQRALLRDGSAVIDGDGLPMLSPQIMRAQQARDAILRFGREFGMTPAAAASVRAGPSAKDREAEDRRKRFAVLGAGKAKAK